jgi:hypothetical protein
MEPTHDLYLKRQTCRTADRQGRRPPPLHHPTLVQPERPRNSPRPAPEFDCRGSGVRRQTAAGSWLVRSVVLARMVASTCGCYMTSFRRLVSGAVKSIAFRGRMSDRLKQLFVEPMPTRYLALRFLDNRLNLLGYAEKLRIGSIERPHYGYCMLEAAKLAAKLGHTAISVIEFGVAGGNGLLAMERHAGFVKQETGIEIEIFGFDMGTGLPPPQDYRDLPYLWQSGYYQMDKAKLEERLERSKLIIGPVEETVKSFLESFGSSNPPPPIGFISFDLDYYSSTVEAFHVFSGASTSVLPRVICYFDDISGDCERAFNIFTGELLAIAEFNAANDYVKIAECKGLRFSRGNIPREWHEQIYIAHLFRHPDYQRPIFPWTQLPLS